MSHYILNSFAKISATLAAGLAVSLAISVAPVSADVVPGDLITKANADKVKGLVPEGIMWCVLNGMDLEIVPYVEVPAPLDYIAATEKFSAQVKLGDDLELIDWVAGMPFPNIDNNDPMAAAKIMYNFQRSHYFSETLDLAYFDADTGTMLTDAKGNPKYLVERHFIPEWLRVLRYQGRLRHDPIPDIEPNDDKVFYKAGLYPLVEPFDLKGVGGVSYRYLEQERHDDTWLYLPLLRRVRRLSSSQRSDALFGQDIDIDSYGGYAGQIPWFEWRLLGEKTMLASIHGVRLPPTPCKGDGGLTFCEVWEKRPATYIVEGRSKLPNYAFSKRLIYVDKETSLIGTSDLYDWNDELWKNVQISFRADKKPNPAADLEYDEVRLFAYAYSVVDIQLTHSTRVAIPGLAIQDEPGWYVDLGPQPPSSVEQNWFSVQSLIAGGR
jgi:hypothetical protein